MLVGRGFHFKLTLEGNLQHFDPDGTATAVLCLDLVEAGVGVECTRGWTCLHSSTKVTYNVLFLKKYVFLFNLL